MYSKLYNMYNKYYDFNDLYYRNNNEELNIDEIITLNQAIELIKKICSG